MENNRKWKVGDDVMMIKTKTSRFSPKIEKGSVVKLVDFHKKYKEDKKPWLVQFNERVFWISEKEAELIE